MKDYVVKIVYLNNFSEIEIPVKAKSKHAAIKKAKEKFTDMPYEDIGLNIEIVHASIVS